jgi:hypothetical protein
MSLTRFHAAILAVRPENCESPARNLYCPEESEENMTDRRAFIRTSLSLPAATVVAGSLRWIDIHAMTAPTLQLERFLYDVRFAESYDVARTIAQSGIETSGFADDLMALWYDDLDLRWKEAPMTLGGITMPESVFVLETFALDRGMRVIYRGEHAPASNGSMTHTLAGPTGMLEAMSHARGEWTERLAEAITQCPADTDDRSELSFATQTDALSLRDVPLISWIIAPRSANSGH